jgi:hypothetical protein
LGACGEENSGDEFGDGEIIFAVAVASQASLKAGAVGGEEWATVTGFQDTLGGFDGGANGGRVKWFKVAEAWVEEELRSLGIGGFVGSLLRRGRQSGVDVADEDSLAEVGGGGFAEFGGLGMGFGGGADDVEAGDAAVEPEAGDVGEIGGGDVRIEVEENADVVATGFVDEVVEIVQGTVEGVDGLGVGRVGLDGSEENCVGAEGLDVVEVLCDAV